MSWDDEKAYEYTKTHTIRDWGWEFIRRNPQYVQEWQKELNDFYQLGKAKKNWEEDSHTDLNTFNPQDTNTFVIFASGIDNWGMQFYQNPDSTKLFVGDAGEHQLSFPIQIFSDDECPSFSEHTLTVQLNCLMPLKTQLERLEKMAKQKQARLVEERYKAYERDVRTPSHYPELWTTYIRCLDAHTAGARKKEVANVLFHGAAQTPGERWDETLRQAKQMMTEGFLHLMYSPDDFWDENCVL